jgi:hypothetical protein
VLGVSLLIVVGGTLALIGLVLAALAFVLTKVGLIVNRRVQRRRAERRLAQLARSQWGPLDSDPTEPRPLGRWVGVALLAAGALEIGAAFGTYVRVDHRSYTLYGTMFYGRIPYFAGPALLVGLGVAALMSRRSRLINALIIGYAALTVPNLAVGALELLAHAPFSHRSGYYLLLGGFTCEIAAIAGAATAILSAAFRARPASSATRLLGAATAVIAAASVAILPLQFRGQGVIHGITWAFGSLPYGTGIIVIVALCSLGLVPLLAIRIGNPSRAMLFAFAARLSLTVVSTAIEQRDVHRVEEFSIGFWLECAGVVSLVALGVLGNRRAATRDPFGPPPLAATA